MVIMVGLMFDSKNYFLSVQSLNFTQILICVFGSFNWAYFSKNIVYIVAFSGRKFAGEKSRTVREILA